MAEEQFIESESITIDLQRVRRILWQNCHLIVGTTLLCAAIGVLFALLAFHEKYRSESTVLMNTQGMPYIVTNYGRSSGSLLKSDPIKNQETLIKSRLLAKKVIKHFSQKHPGKLSDITPDYLAEKVIQVTPVSGTDFIKLSAIWDDPTLARAMVKSYLNSYFNLSDSILRQPLSHEKKLLIAKVKDSTNDLETLNDKIRLFQLEHDVVDINAEIELTVEEIQGLGAKIKRQEADLVEKNTAFQKLTTQLNLSPQQAIASVAGGFNDVLRHLAEELNEVEREINIKSVTYAPTNPTMVKLREKAAVLNRQIEDQQIKTVGRKFETGDLVITDSIRADMVRKLTNLETERSAIKNKLATFRAQKKALEKKVAHMPHTKLKYAELTLKKRNTEEILTRLQEKLAEVKIQEAGIHQKLRIIDVPSLPHSPIFPGKLHIILIFTVVGLVMSSTVTVGFHYLQQNQIRPEFLEHMLNIPVLTVLPWVARIKKKKNRLTPEGGNLQVLQANSHQATIAAYQDLALNLSVQGNLHQKNAFAMASLYQDPSESFIASNLGYCLAQGGQRVVLVDTNLRNPRLHETFGHSLNYEKGLPELINTVSEMAAKNPNLQPEELFPIIQQALIPSQAHPNLCYINAGVSLDNTFEFLNAKGFSLLVNGLKEYFDWALFDTSSLLNYPDTAVLLRQVDSLLMIVEQQADEAQLRQAAKKVQQVQGNIIGAIMRQPLD
ncbi:MAG: hypothetical protein KTR14_05180 [Vampirovibrio sp.]|nr:hypothetical protein [Vampirovibrio sp.]